MKRPLVFITILLLVLSNFTFIPVSSTVIDGVTIVQTIDELKAVTGTGSYKLMATIDLSGEVWTSIGGFSGTFDGNASSGYKIINLNGNCSGLFDTLGNGHYVKNLVLENVNIVKSGNEAGALARVASYGTIENCAVINAKVQADTFTGGFVCKNDHSTIKNSFVEAGGTGKGIMSGAWVTGGLVAYSEFGYIYDCYFNGTVKSLSTGNNANTVGGIVGKAIGNGSEQYVARCYATGSIAGDAGGSNYGGIAGISYNDDGNWKLDVKNNFSLVSSIISTATSGRISGESSSYSGRYSDNYALVGLAASGEKGATTKEGADITFEQAKTFSTYTNAGWDSNIWIASVTGYEYPTLKNLPSNIQPQYSILDDKNIIRVRTIDELKAVTGNGSYKLMATIDLSAEVWTSISGFYGTFDGNAISGYKITNLNGNCSGLFDTLGNGHYVKNLVLENVNIVKTGDEAGALARVASYGIIENCAVINAKVQASSYLGGFVCKNDHSTIKTSFVEADGTEKGIITGAWVAGGLVAYNEFGYVYDCYFKGTVKTTATGSNARIIGGIVGKAIGNGSDHYIARCYVTGSIEGDIGGSYYGGIVGMSCNDDGSWILDIKNNFSLVNSITATATSGRISGGSVEYEGRFSNNYSLGNMSIGKLDKGLLCKDGRDISFEEATNIATYISSWSNSLWIMGDGTYNLPILSNIPSSIQKDLLPIAHTVRMPKYSVEILSVDKVNEKYEVTTYVDNLEGGIEAVKVVTVFYDSNNKLINVVVKSLSLGVNNNTQQTDTFDLQETPSVVKVFIVESLENIKPVSEVAQKAVS